MVLVDRANVWKSGIDIELLYKYLKTNKDIDKIILYFWLDWEARQSASFLSKAKIIWYEIKHKMVKKIPKKMNNSEFKKIHESIISNLKLLDKQLTGTQKYMENSWIINNVYKLLDTVVHDRKADFDVEITMDILLNIDNYDWFILFSWDWDYKAPINYWIIKNKKMIVIHRESSLWKEIQKLWELYPELDIFEIWYINRKLWDDWIIKKSLLPQVVKGAIKGNTPLVK